MPVASGDEMDKTEGHITEAQSTTINGAMLPLQGIGEEIWRQALLDAGVPHFKMYNAFRHSLARNLLQQGYGFDVVAEVLGHASVEMTRAYYADMPLTIIRDALTDLSQSQQWDGR